MISIARALCMAGLAGLALSGCDTGEQDTFTYWLERWGMVGGCLGSYLGGLLVSLTPCVYPMIVLTVSIFGASEGTSRKKATLLSVCFVLGLCAMYTPLGVVAGLTGGVFAAYMGSIWIMGPIVILLLALAASMFGFWELTLPSALQNKLSTVGGAGFVGAFLMGLVAGLLAAPCAGPVTIALLTFVGSTGDPVGGGVYFFFYALGIGTLFFFVGAFALSLPRSGKWTDWIKSFAGLAIVALCGYYAMPFYSSIGLPLHEIWFLVLGGILVVAGLALGAAHLSVQGEPIKVKVRKAVAIVLFGLGSAALTPAVVSGPQEIEWRDDYEVAYEAARSAGRPMLIDFTATWCPACMELERETFSDDSVAAEAQRFMAIRVDASLHDEASAEFMARLNVQGLPTVLVIDDQGQERGRVVEFIEPDEMIELFGQVP